MQTLAVLRTRMNREVMEMLLALDTLKLWVQLEVMSNPVARLQDSPNVWLGLDNAAPAGRRAQFWVRCLGVVGSHVAHSVGQSGSG